MFYARIRHGLLIVLLLVFTSCSRPPSNEAQGYIEGRYIYMATSVAGALQQLAVARGTPVKQGQLLFALEEQPESDAYNAAIEDLRQAIQARAAIVANLAYAKVTYERNKTLVPQHAIQQAALDNAKSNYEALLAQLEQANANIAASNAALAQAKWRKDQKIVSAPVNGMVFETYFRAGEYVAANQPVVSLLAPENIKAIFYVNESVLGALHLGDKVKVRCDGCSQAYWGRISFISPTAEYTPPIIYSTETNDKLVYRIEAQFPPVSAIHLHPGQPVSVTYSNHDR